MPFDWMHTHSWWELLVQWTYDNQEEVQSAQQEGIRRLEIESDTELLVKILNREHHPWLIWLVSELFLDTLNYSKNIKFLMYREMEIDVLIG